MDAAEISRCVLLPLHTGSSKNSPMLALKAGVAVCTGFWLCLGCKVSMVRCKPCSLVDVVKFLQGMIVSSYIISSHSLRAECYQFPQPLSPFLSPQSRACVSQKNALLNQHE